MFSSRTPTTPPTQLALGPGQNLWLCLPPGSALHASQGEVAVRWAPADCGGALHTLPHTRLTAGEHLPWSGRAPATWVQLHNPSHHPAQIQLEEATPWAAGRLTTILQRLRAALRHPEKAAKNPGHHGAWHSAR